MPARCCAYPGEGSTVVVGSGVVLVVGLAEVLGFALVVGVAVLLCCVEGAGFAVGVGAGVEPWEEPIP